MTKILTPAPPQITPKRGTPTPARVAGPRIEAGTKTPLTAGSGLRSLQVSGVRPSLSLSGSPLSARYAAIPKLIDLVQAPAFIDTSLTQASADDPVGFALNRASGAGYSGEALTGLGSELVTNGGFDTDLSGWSIFNGDGASSVGGRAHVVAGSQPNGRIYQQLTTVAGSYYLLEGVADQGTSGASPQIKVGTSAGQGQIESFDTTSDFARVFRAETATTFVTLQNNDTGAGEYAAFDNISVREIPGPQAIAPNASAKPRLEADGSLFFNGSASYLEIAAPTDGFPNAVYAAFAIKTTDAQFILMSNGASSSQFVVTAHVGATHTTIHRDAGDVSLFIDGALFEGETRDDTHAALCDGQWHFVEVLCDPSAWGMLQIGGYGTSWLLNGHLSGPVICDVAANGMPTDKERADIRTHMMQGLS